MPKMPDGAQWFETQLRAAVQRQVSDLVFEPDDAGGYQAVERQDGLRMVQAQCPAAWASAVVARAKALACLPAYISDEVQDGSFAGDAFAVDGRIRLAVLPTVRGQRLALRLPALGPLPAVEGLGFPAQVVDDLRHCLAQPDGMLLWSGPTGSGKTTSMHSFLRELQQQREDRAIIAIEDPVERLLPGVSHVAVDAQRGRDPVACVRAALRQDADIVVVGEIRDGSTATACVRAALAGHLVVASVHAPRAREVVPRLLDMGVDADLLLPALRGVCAQRVLRRLQGDGYAGRMPVVDWIPVDHQARQAWRQGRGEHLALAHDMDQQAASLVADQHTDVAECQRVLGISA